MTALLEAALELQNFFTLRQWQFCIIGGIALLRWGEPRFTRDVDATLLTGFGSEDEFIELILSAGYRGRIPDAAGFARRNRVPLLDSAQGVPIDIALGALSFEAAVVGRASLFSSLFADETWQMWRLWLCGNVAAWTGLISRPNSNHWQS